MSLGPLGTARRADCLKAVLDYRVRMQLMLSAEVEAFNMPPWEKFAFPAIMSGIGCPNESDDASGCEDLHPSRALFGRKTMLHYDSINGDDRQRDFQPPPPALV